MDMRERERDEVDTQVSVNFADGDPSRLRKGRHSSFYFWKHKNSFRVQEKTNKKRKRLTEKE
uniref:Uncharacterized protein MANES_10G077600 n=1 Tax=Rhizophora mucronata TaxID=61149 RepID=A0A2P2MB38_RHIMU